MVLLKAAAGVSLQVARDYYIMCYLSVIIVKQNSSGSLTGLLTVPGILRSLFVAWAEQFRLL